MVFTPGGSSNVLDIFMDTVTATFRNLWVNKYEVTQEEYARYMGEYPWAEYITNPYNKTGNNYPAYGMTWFEMLKYCNAKSAAEGLQPVYSYTSISRTSIENLIVDTTRNGYRLPTSYERKYICRADAGGDFYWGSDASAENIGKYAWWGTLGGQYDTPEFGQAIVGERIPNNWGLYDMSGNVSEGVCDSDDETSEYCKYFCGSFMSYSSSELTINYLYSPTKTSFSYTIGFRIVRNCNQPNIIYLP